MNDLETAKALFFEGVASLNAQNFADAELRFREALRRAPKSVPVLTNLAIVLFTQEKLDEALDRANEAVSSDGNNIEAHLIVANCFAKKKRYAEALASCDRIIALEPDLADAYVNRAAALIELNQPEESLASCNRAIAMVPDFASAHYSRGTALRRLGRREEALASYDKAIGLKPDLAKAWIGRGNIFVELKRQDEAATAYGKALSINPNIEDAQGIHLHLKMHNCDWSNFETDCAKLLAGVRKGLPVAHPFALLGIPCTPADQSACAKNYVARVFPASIDPLWRGEIYSHDRIRIAYVSADFKDHAIAHVIAGLLEHHDKMRFQTFAISLGVNDGSAWRARIVAAFDQFIDAANMSDAEIGKSMRDKEIDIVIDLAGFTQDSRPSIFAMRPSPINVYFLGCAGTLGANYFDYIIGDRTVMPQDHWEYFTEKVVWLPDCYFPHDDQRPISKHTPTRSECGLPEKAFVFCCFNNTYKIVPAIFAVWMRLLQATEGSVLWLSEANSTAKANLRRIAQVCGIAPERLIFASKVPAVEDHLARHSLADLFLDTLPFNAHTTASDALWAGLPVVTCMGETFAGRVAASVVTAAGLPELVTTSLEDYEALVLKLARDPDLLASIKSKLAQNRATCPMFDTARFTRHLESAYTTMWERYQKGEAPAAFAVDAA